MLSVINHGWVNPIDCVDYLCSKNFEFALLLSSMQTSYSGRYSWLGVDIYDVAQDHSFEELLDFHNKIKEELSLLSDKKLPLLFGFIGYEMGAGSHCCDRGDNEPDTPLNKLDIIDFPGFVMMGFKKIYCFDHVFKKVTEYCLKDTSSLSPLEMSEYKSVPNEDKVPDIVDISSNMTKESYIESVKKTIEQINAGEFYQANITRKYLGKWKDKPDYPSLFKRLCKASPAPYSSLIKLPDGNLIMSSSPELFLNIDNTGNITARPIKGTMDIKKGSADDLANSLKDKAENLMIVDLMRHDLSAVSISGSVQVPSLYEIDKFSTLYHMSSVITSKMQDDISLIDAVKSIFPPGSMTGAPKIAAINWCKSQELVKRGIYSGAIGWLGANSCELSVVIRTLLIADDRFEFQVGGAIVADSKPEKEFDEIITKAKGMLKAIGANIDDISF